MAPETFQNYAESARRDVEAAGLEPDTICIRNPEAVIFQVGVGNEVFAAPSMGSRPSVKLLKAVIGICPS